MDQMEWTGCPELASVSALAVVAACASLLGCSGDQSASRNSDRTDSAGSPASNAHNPSAASAAGGAPAPIPGAAGAPGAQMMGSVSSSPSKPAVLPPSHVPSPTLDPNVRFDWPESSPSNSNSCQGGTYTGMFDCTFTDPSGTIPSVELTGPVSLTFSKSMDGEFLEITQGDFEAVGNLFIGGKAKIQGKLDCNTLTLDAMAVDGAWSIGDPNAPLIPGGDLEGQITGTLDPSTNTLSGMWSFADPSLGACPGTWSVMLMP